MSDKLKSLSVLDRMIRYVSPTAFNRRQIARISSELLTVRQYNAARSNPQNVIRGNSRSATAELSGAINPIKNNVRELYRNAPFAKKTSEVIVNAVVSWGIQAAIFHPDKKREQILRDHWKRWCDGLCSIDGKSDFYSQQKDVMGTVVNDGEVIVREVPLDGSIRQLILESDYICTAALKEKIDPAFRYLNGIVQDRFGRPQYYNFYDWHPGDLAKLPPRSLIAASELDLIYRKDRPEQNRGVSWFAPVVESINMLSELQYTHLLKMKLSSAITAVVTQGNSTLPAEILKAQREIDWQLNAGDVKFLSQGENIEFPTIPNTEGFEPSTRLALREITAGVGTTYEAVSNDLTGVNFSSYKAGDIQFRANVDNWRWHLLIPQFCNPSFERFKKYCRLKGIDPSGVTVSWTPPIRQMIDPSGEITALKDAVRSGFQSYPAAIRELGYDFDTHLAEIARSNEALDKFKIVLDSDPRRTGNQQLQSPESLAAMWGDKSEPQK